MSFNCTTDNNLRPLQKKQGMTEGGVEVNIDPEDLEGGLDKKGLEAKYEEQLRKQQKVRSFDQRILCLKGSS